jgi:hypothetical protein
MYYDFDENEILEEGLFSDIKDRIHLYSSVKQLQKNVMSTSADHMSNRTDTNIELMGGGPEGMPFGHKLIIEDGYITIKNINFVKFFQRIKEFYAENNFSKIFMKVYTNKSEKLWKKGKVSRKEMAVKYLKFPVFFVSKLIGKDYFQRKLKESAGLKSFDDNKYVGCFVWLSGGIKDIHKREWFDDYVVVPFEKYEFRVPAKYHEMLRHGYGDYMQLPPENERIGHHYYKVYEK